MSNSNNSEFIGSVIFLIVAAIVTFVVILMPTDNEHAVRTMENAGFKDVKVLESSKFFSGLRGCSGNSDQYTFEMQGINPNGKHVNATVCCGLAFKGCTIRY